jgi:hypothetical protein
MYYDINNDEGGVKRKLKKHVRKNSYYFYLQV